MSIEVKNITKTFVTFRALHDVTLTVPTGKLVALLGPSGSGKTTLLRIIAGLEQPDSGCGGEILFHEENVAGRHVRERHVGFVFQHYALFRHMSVFENVAFGLRVRPRKLRPSKQEISDRVHALLKLVQLDGLAPRYPHQLSGGQRQRVALARALAVEPKVLLLDEPFGALDAKVRKELRAWLRRLHDEIHVTSVFVTHDQDEALEVSDQVVVMNAGRIEQIGTPDEVFHQPRSSFVLGFLGEVNRFHGRIDANGLQFANMTVDAPAGQQGDGRAVNVFIRPHEFELSAQPGGAACFPARVKGVLSAGPTVRLELVGPGEVSFCADVSRERYQRLALSTGSQVFVTPKGLRVFADEPDFVI